jgi:phenylalanyl-tRNA synthetase beta chain
MQVLKSWLKDYVDIDLTDQELSDKLSLTGTSIEEIKSGLDSKIIVAQIREVNPHPNADRLQIAQVFDGTNELQIVCGAPNIAVGQKVPLATIGAKIQDFEIKQAQIRGVDSFGMMCSSRELGLGEDYDGIKILSEDFEIGKPLNNYIESDTIFDIEITPNRGDCLSHLGVAREISVITDKKLKDLEKIDIDQTENGKINIEIEAKNLCNQYSAIYIQSVKVAPSPEWLKNRLISLGSRPINNVVDITNYVLLEWGQPLHAFDASKITNSKIIIRQSKEQEKIVTLDGQVRTIPDGSLVIADQEKAIAAAGIMGGANSQVDNNTQDIIIESAEFDAASIRKTSKVLGLSTDASYRFERGIDSGRVFESAKYAAKLITEIAGGSISDVIYTGEVPGKQTIKMEYDKINALLGLKLSSENINKILINLGFEIENNNASIPLWRHDIAIWQDLAEEIGRVYGYEKITPIEMDITKASNNTDYFKKEYLKESLTDFGFSETVNYVFVSAYDAQTDEIETHDLLEIKNPMQNENKYLRNSLIPGLLKNVAKNPSFDPILLFEFGHIFDIHNEKNSIGLIASGKDSKKKIEAALELLKEKLKIGNEIEILEISKDKLLKKKIRKSSVYACELILANELDNLVLTEKIDTPEAPVTKVLFKQVSKYPPAVRDLAFIAKDDVDSHDIMNTILNLSENILLVDLFDEFSSPKFGVKKKNIAYHIYLQDMQKALLDSEADQIIKKIVLTVEDKYQAKLRD